MVYSTNSCRDMHYSYPCRLNTFANGRFEPRHLQGIAGNTQFSTIFGGTVMTLVAAHLPAWNDKDE